MSGTPQGNRPNEPKRPQNPGVHERHEPSGNQKPTWASGFDAREAQDNRYEKIHGSGDPMKKHMAWPRVKKKNPTENQCLGFSCFLIPVKFLYVFLGSFFGPTAVWSFAAMYKLLIFNSSFFLLVKIGWLGCFLVVSLVRRLLAVIFTPTSSQSREVPFFPKQYKMTPGGCSGGGVSFDSWWVAQVKTRSGRKLESWAWCAPWLLADSFLGRVSVETGDLASDHLAFAQ